MEPNGNRPNLMDVVLDFFQEEQWNYQQLNDRSIIRAGYRGERGTWVCYARVEEENQRFLFHSFIGLNIAPEYRLSVAEYLTRVNYCLPVGNFDMDFETGEVRFRAGIETPEGELSVKMVRALAYASVRAMDQYFPGLLAVVRNGLSPTAALARVDAQTVELS